MNDTVDAFDGFVKGIFLLDIGHDDEGELASIVVVEIDEIVTLGFLPRRHKHF